MFHKKIVSVSVILKLVIEAGLLQNMKPRAIVPRVLISVKITTYADW